MGGQETHKLCTGVSDQSCGVCAVATGKAIRLATPQGPPSFARDQQTTCCLHQFQHFQVAQICNPTDAPCKDAPGGPPCFEMKSRDVFSRWSSMTSHGRGRRKRSALDMDQAETRFCVCQRNPYSRQILANCIVSANCRRENGLPGRILPSPHASVPSMRCGSDG